MSKIQENSHSKPTKKYEQSFFINQLHNAEDSVGFTS